MDMIMGERRAARRYDVELELRYKLIRGHRVVLRGHGKTLTMSRDGLSFTADGDLPAGSAVELSIKWPIALYGRYPLELHVMGHVIRGSCGEVAVRTTWHEFLRLDSLVERRPEVREAQTSLAM